MKREYKVITLDVWGNDNDGYEVNNAHYTGQTITLLDSDADQTILKKLNDSDIGDFPHDLFDIDGSGEFSLYINWKENGKPELELRLSE